MMFKKNLRGYDGNYTISISGTVRDKKGMTIPTGKSGNGHLVVKLIKSGKEVIKRLDKLVARNFRHNDNPKKKKYVVIKDGNKNNLLASNLIWATKKQHKNYKPKVKEVSTVPGVRKAKGIVAIDIHTGKEHFYDSSSLAETALGIPATKIRKAIRKNEKINNYKFQYT